jgi:hypothetical protein
VHVGQGRDIGQLGELEAAGVERVEVVLQCPVTIVGPDTGFPQAAVAAHRAGVEVVGDVPVGDGTVGVVEREREPAAGFERGREGGGEPAVVGDVAEYQVAAHGVETPGRGRQRLAEVGDLVVNGAAGVPGAGQLDQARRQVDPGDVRTARGQGPGEVALAAAGVKHLAAVDVPQQVQQGREQAERVDVGPGLLPPGHVRRVLVGVAVVVTGGRGRCGHNLSMPE